jgi:hypothetical protein
MALGLSFGLGVPWKETGTWYVLDREVDVAPDEAFVNDQNRGLRRPVYELEPLGVASTGSQGCG